MITISHIEKIFDEGLSLVDHLPYGEYLDGLFLHVDGSVGRIWELEPLETEAMEAVRLEAVSHGVAGFVSRIPPGMHAQIMAWSDPDVMPVLGRYKELSRHGIDPLVDAVIDGKIGHMSCIRDEGRAFKRIRIFLTLRYFPEWGVESMAEMMRAYFTGKDDKHAHFQKAWSEIRAHFLRTCALIENQFVSLGVVFKAVDDHGLLQFLYRWFNPDRSRQINSAHLRRDLIREQVLFNAPEARGKGFIFEDFHTRVVSLKELPQATFPGMFSTDFMDIHPGMLTVLNFTVPDQQQALERIKFQKAFAFIQRTSSMGDTSEEAVQKKEELSALITQTFKSGKAIIQMRMHVILMDQDEGALERACDVLMVRLHATGADGLKEEIIAPSLFLTCMPLNFDQRYEHIIRRERRLLSDNFADMTPFYGALRGTMTPAVLYANRRSMPVGIDLFDSSTNPHGMIIGASGAGKSFLTNDFIYQNYRLGAHFFVLDKGHSYRKTCALLEGQYVHFDLKAPLTMNPFAADLTDENAAFLLEVLALMASGGDERDRVTREEKGSLQIALSEAYRSISGREVTLTDIVKSLEGGDARRLALKLMPFTRQGPYGKFFDGPNQFVIDRRFTVFELADLSAYPELQLVVLLNIMFCVTQFVSSEKMKAERKFLLIDEAWQLLKMANTADFIANAFKTFRKCRCSVVAITQEVADLLQQKSGAAIMANTANKIFLKQEPSVIEQLKKELCFSDEVADLLRSVNTVKGQYAEALVMTPSSTGVARLTPDPFLYWAATSEAKDNAYLDDIRRDENYDLVTALKHAAKHYPYGVR
ncbi:MAG: TraC family protein [Candidatus Omnitrophica bacterium]|nr:TraC family protein [Candidatus Omnitrophota bacterium]